MDCDLYPVAGLASYVSTSDWLEDLIDANDPAGCHGDKAHKSTQYDVLRYLWDMLTDENVPFEDLVDIYDEANPRSWNPTHDIFTPADDPEQRWASSADDNGHLGAHYNVDGNGMDH